MRSLSIAGHAHRLAWVTAGATLCLVVAGGLVTNTGAALAVPDWPTTFGYNLFLFPWSHMVGGVLLEHSHRLLGSVVGLLTLALGGAIWLTDRRGWMRTLGVVVVGLVGVQGLLGGLRVVLRQDALAIVHGCVAQTFFALEVALAVFTSPGRAAPAPALAPGVSRDLRRLSVAVALLLYGQIVLGALATHLGWATAHVGGAFVVVAAVGLLAGRALARPVSADGIGAWARALATLLVVQVVLGVGAYLVRFTGLAVPGGQITAIGFPVAHRVVGAGLFGVTVVLTLRIWPRPAHGRVRPSGALGADLTSTRVPA
jgi:cytochrome c oxidase assembly protein subunit 15